MQPYERTAFVRSHSGFGNANTPNWVYKQASAGKKIIDLQITKKKKFEIYPQSFVLLFKIRRKKKYHLNS